MLRSPTPRPEPIRQRGVEILQALVTHAVVLRRTVHDAHVNVRGMQFESLHKLFGEVYDLLNAHVDLLKERIRTLGGTPVDGLTPAEEPTNPDGAHLCDALGTLVSEYAAAVDAAFYETSDLRLTADAAVLQNEMPAIEKLGWRLLSHV